MLALSWYLSFLYLSGIQFSVSFMDQTSTTPPAGLGNFSRLPKELLSAVISSLPIKDAVRTSVLSKTWQYLYTSSHNLDFSFRFGDTKTKLDDVANAVHRLFYYRTKSPINRFRIRWEREGSFDPLHIQGWIRCVMWHGIREINLHVFDELLLPPRLFTCDTLVELRLFMLDQLGPDSKVPAKVHLPNLKVLHLSNCLSFPSEDTASERLLSNCPVLEDFEYVFDDEDCKLIINSPTLKRLVIRYERSVGRDSGNLEIRINTPSLTYWEYDVYQVDLQALINLQSLTVANIDYYEDDYNYATQDATDLMRAISNVCELSITTLTLKDFLVLNVPIPAFHRLTHLKLDFRIEFGLAETLDFLTLCESLETLVFQGPVVRFNLDASYPLEESRARCLLSRVKTIEIHADRLEDNQIELARYLLQNARVLKVMKIDVFRKYDETQLEKTEKIIALPRASEECNVVVYFSPR